MFINHFQFPNPMDAIVETLKCPVCPERVTLACQHNFCRACITQVDDAKCPVCRLVSVVPPDTNDALNRACRQVEQYNESTPMLASTHYRKIKIEYGRQDRDSFGFTVLTVVAGGVWMLCVLGYLGSVAAADKRRTVSASS